ATATRPPRSGRRLWAGSVSPGQPPRSPEPTSRRWRRSFRRTARVVERSRLASGRWHRAEGAGLGQELLQLAALVHLQRDVTAADQLSLDVQLRVGGPVGEALERLANLRLLKNIDVLELGAHGAQRGHRLRGKPALRKVRRTLHEQHHGARAELGLDPFHDIHLYITSSVCAARQAPPADAIAQPRSWTASVRSPRPCADSRRTSPAHRARRR